MKKLLVFSVLFALVFSSSSFAVEYKVALESSSLDSIDEGILRHARPIGTTTSYQLTPVTDAAEAVFRQATPNSVLCITGAKRAWDELLIRSARFCAK